MSDSRLAFLTLDDLPPPLLPPPAQSLRVGWYCEVLADAVSVEAKRLGWVLAAVADEDQCQVRGLNRRALSRLAGLPFGENEWWPCVVPALAQLLGHGWLLRLRATPGQPVPWALARGGTPLVATPEQLPDPPRRRSPEGPSGWALVGWAVFERFLDAMLDGLDD